MEPAATTEYPAPWRDRDTPVCLSLFPLYRRTLHLNQVCQIRFFLSKRALVTDVSVLAV